MKKQRLLILAIVICLLACLFTACGTVEHTCNFDEWTVTKQPTCTETGERERFCSCGEKQTSSLAATGHSYTHVVTDPTCTEQGFTTHTCAGCGDSYVDTYVKVTDHSYTAVVTPPTCTKQGYTTYTCACGDSYVDTYVDETGHTEGLVIVENMVNATCTGDGSYDNVVYCTVCDAELSRETKTIDALGHDEVEHIAQAPTCTEIGWDAYVTCSRCDYSTYNEIPATGHTDGEWIIDVEPSCTIEGSKHQVCATCEVTIKTETIDALGHKHTAVVTEPTCTEQGYTTHTCHCGDSYVDTYVDATGHTGGAVIVENKVDATCTTDGSYDNVVYCTICEVELSRETKTVDALGHDEIEHSAQAPTCTEIGWDAYVTCSRCDYTTYVEIPATGHSFGDWTEIKPATCTENGLELKNCICGATVTKVIEATGHSHDAVVKEPTCTEQGYTIHTCHCGDSSIDTYVDSLGHDEINHNAQAPTCTEIGWDAYVTCSRCDYSTYNEIPATGHTDGEWIIDVEPDCITRGRKHQVCATCGETSNIEIIDYKHIYDNACDGECNVCRYNRTQADHIYDNASDEDCNECGEIRIIFEHLQEVDYWYSNTDVVMTMVGYVVEIATEYSSSYQNVSLYIVDEDFCAGYYLYRVKCDDETADQLVPGAPVIVTGTMNTDYNGLMQTNSGGTIKIDSGRTSVNVRDHVYAIDNEIIGGLFSANYHQSSLVSLTNWTVKEVKEAPSAASSTETLFILTKGGVDVPVIVSKYHEGSYKRFAGDTVWEGLVNHGVQVGDIVSITGILGNYKGHQIALLSASDIVKGGTADPEDTVYPGKTAATAIEAIDNVLKAVGTDNIISDAKTIALPIVDGVEISARVIGNSRALSVEDGAIIVTPGKYENSCIRFDVKVGDFTTSIFRYIKSEDLDDAEKLATEKATFDIELTEIVRNSTIELPTTGSIFEDITIVWSFKADTGHDCATLDGATLTVTPPKEATTITLVATLSLGEATPVTKEFTISVAKAEAKILIDVDSLGLEEEKYQDGNGVVDGVGFAYVELGDYGNGIQMRNKSAVGGKQSKIANTTALGTGIAKIVITLFSSNYDNTDAFAFRFGTSASDLTAQVIMLSTVKGQFVYEITPDAETYTFFSMEDALTYSFYIESIQIYYNGEIVAVHSHTYVWTDNGDGTCSAVCSEDATHTLAAREHADSDSNYVCDNCSATIPTYTTVADAVAGYAGSYIDITATVKSIDTPWSDQYMNISFTITDGTNDLYAYRCGGVDVKVGYQVKVVGKLSEYSGTKQIINGTVSIVSAAPECEHEYDNACDASCNKCGDVRTVGDHIDTDTNNKCDSCGADLTPAAIISAPVDGTYTMYLVQATLGKTLYFAGEINSDEHCTATDIADNAAIITITKTGDNAYTLKVGEKFLEIYINGAGRSRTRLVDTANGTWAWDSTIGIFTWTVDSTAYYLGTFDSNAIIRASALSYITGDNASKLGVSQFVCQYEAVAPACTHAFDNVHDNECNLCSEPNPDYVADHEYDNACDADCNLCGETRIVGDHIDADTNYVCDNCGATIEAPAPVVCPLVVGTGYTISSENANGIIYFIGTVTSGRFDGSLDANDASVVYIENAANAGEYYLYMTDGTTKTYIVIDDKSTGAALTTDVAEATAFEWNADKSTLAVAEDTNNRAFATSATSTYNNFSCYDLIGSYSWGQFTAVESSEPACTHEYDNACDVDCNLCGEARTPADHVYDNNCDADCNVCGATRTVGNHIDDNSDVICDICGEQMDIAQYLIFTLNDDESGYIISYADKNLSGDITLPSEYQGKPVTTIGGGAFYKCTSLTDITIPANVTTIGGSAFEGCTNLTSITIPASVTTIDGYAFVSCGITDVYYTGTLEQWCGISFGYCSIGGNRHINGELLEGELVIPSTVTEIKDFAFQGTGLTSIVIPASVTTIGSRAFEYCYDLTSVTFGENSQLTSIRSYAFYCCESLTSIVIPDGVTSIGDWAFQGTGLTSIVIPSSVTTISGAFYECYNLTNIYYSGTEEQWNNISISDCNDVLTNATIHYNYVASALINGTWGDLTWTLNESTGELVISGEGEMRGFSFLSTDAWRNYSSLIKSVTIENGVTTIGDLAFFYCDSLTSVTIGGSVTTIGDLAFNLCDSLTSVTIGGSVTAIGGYAFGSCYALAEVYNYSSLNITKGSEEYGCVAHYAFDVYTTNEPSKLTTDKNGFVIHTNGNVKTLVRYIGTETEITIPDSVTTIGEFAFCGCSSLTSIVIPDTVTTIGENAFANCDSLTNAYYAGTKEQWNAISIGTTNTTLTNATRYYYSDCIHNGNQWRYDSDGNISTELTTGDWIVDVEPTCTTDGSKHKECDVCHETTETEVIPAGHNYEETIVPPTAIEYGYTLNQCTNCTHNYKDEYRSVEGMAFSINDDGETCTITGIGNCTETDIVIPEKIYEYTVTAIGDCAFYECGCLTSITIPDGVTTIGYAAFAYCTNLTSVTFGENSKLTTIGYGAFYGCYRLTSIVIPDSVTTIDELAFYQCSLTNVTFEENSQLTTIGYSAFVSCSSLASIEIPDSVNTIDGYAFAYCDSLTSIEIPGSVTAIGEGAFIGCSSLTNITISYGVITIGDYAFSKCYSLTNIDVDINNTAYKSIDGNLYSKDGKTLIQYAIGKTSTTFEIPANVTTIGEYAFSHCSSLTSVGISDVVTIICERAFNNCTSLTDVYYTGAEEQWNAISIGSYNDCLTGATIHYNYTNDNDDAKRLEYTLNEDNETYAITGIGSFNGSTLIIPDTYEGKPVTVIGSDAFKLCDNLKELTIPSSIISIEQWAFGYCRGLEKVTFESESELTTIGDCAFVGCSALTSFEVPSNVTSIGESAFENCNRLDSFSFATNTKIETIGQYGFAACCSLMSFTIPSTVTSIGDAAFWACYKLIEVYNLSSLSITKGSEANGEIGKYALHIYTSAGAESKLITTDDGYVTYYDATNSKYYLMGYKGDSKDLVLLSKINDNNYEIYQYAFAYTNIESVTIPESVTKIGNNAFVCCEKLATVTFSSEFTGTIGNDAFVECNSLKTFTIPSGTTTVKSYIIRCHNLETIYVPNSVTRIDLYAFAYNENLKAIYFDGTIAEWNAIEKWRDWDLDTGNYTVYCTDGNISK